MGMPVAAGSALAEDAGVAAAEAVPFGVFVPDEAGDGLGLPLGAGVQVGDGDGLGLPLGAGGVVVPGAVVGAGVPGCVVGPGVPGFVVGPGSVGPVGCVDGVGLGPPGGGVVAGGGVVLGGVVAGAAGGWPTEACGSVGTAIGGSGPGVPFGAGEPSIGVPPAYTVDSAMTVSTYVVDRL